MIILALIPRSVGNVLWLGFLVAGLFPATASATTIYVDDDNAAVCPCKTKVNQPPDTTCGPTNKPFSCINDALAVQIGGSYADTIIVRDGTYNEDVGVTHGGTSDTQRLTIKADLIHPQGHGGPLISGPSRASVAFYIASKYVTVQGLRITGGSTGFYVAGEDRADGSQPTNQGLGIVVEDTEIFGNISGVLLRMACANVRMTRVDVHDNAPNDGVSLDTYHDPINGQPATNTIFNTILENSHIHHNHNQGIGEGNAINTIVRNSEIDHNGTSGEQHGFYVKGVSGLIQGNKIHHNSGFGVQLWAAPKGTSSQHYIVERNDIFENGSGGVVLGGSFAEANQPTNDGFPHYVEIRYNFIHHNSGGFTFYGGGCNPSLDTSNDNSFHHNTVYNNSSRALQMSGLQNTPTMRLLLKNNIFAGPTYVSGANLVLLQSTNLSPDDIDGNIYYMPGASSSTALFQWTCYACPPPADFFYSFDQIRTSGIVQDNTPRPELGCGSATTVKLDERSRWTDPIVVDATTASWPNAIGMTMGDYHLRRNSPAISGGVCCPISQTGHDYDDEVHTLCLPQSCAAQNSAVAVGADWYQDSNSNGVADRNECNPSDGTVCDCNTQYASNCTPEIPETSEGSESACVALGNPGAPYDATVFPGHGEMCDGKDNDCNSSTTYSGGETDADKDGFFGACQDCNDSDANVNPGAVESPAILQTCFDGVDNDCDGIVDADCAIDALPASQTLATGSVTCGTQGDLSATSVNNTYECLREAKTHGSYQLTALWTFSTVNLPQGTDYEVRVDGYRNTGDNDGFNFSAAVKQGPISPFCTNADVGAAPTIVSITDFAPDPNKLQSADVGIDQAVDQDKICVRLADSNVSSDPSVQDTVTLDRVYLFPVPVAAADYAAGSDIGSVTASGYLPFEATQRSEDVYEVTTEALSNGNNRLSHTWQFKSVPAGTGHVLHFEGHRTAGGTLDDFKFYYATSTAGWSNTDPTAGFTLIGGATINTTLDPAGGVNSSAFGGTGSGTYYIRVIDAQNSGSGSSQNTLFIDHLSIRTNP